MEPALPGDPIDGVSALISDDDRLAHDLAEQAGQLLLELRAADGEADSLRRDGDRRSHEFIAARLATARPGDAVLSEEGRDDPARLSADRVWIVDPLDGTREFGEPGRSDWAVHVALWERGELTAGAVALPAQGRILSTAAPAQDADAQAAAASGGPPARAPGPGGELRFVVSRTRPPEFVQRLAGQVSARLLPLGSAGAKAAEVISGEADAYVHSGGQYEWDSAAPVAVARAAGLHTSRIDGSKLVYNQAVPSVPDILICRAALAGVLLEAIGNVRYQRGD
jgi:3'(2'), 5'-bisphosphate nucleotidase